MGRTLDPAAHALRRDAFIDVAERRILTSGYEQLSIQEVLDELGTSKGAFYHYFDSKADLLESVVDRVVAAAVAAIQPVVDDPSLDAVQKLERVFSTAAAFKAERREVILGLLQAWFSDDNAIVREKVRRIRVNRIAPLLGPVVRQGVAEGVFTGASGDELARILVTFMAVFSDELAELYIERHAGRIDLATVERAFDTYRQTFERILGVRPGTLTLVDRKTILLWYG
jgi:AcrR family transcriptional regulator